jgi:GTP-binding protein HflX
MKTTKHTLESRSVLVHIYFPSTESTYEDLDEFKELATSAGANIITVITGKRDTPDAKYFIGSGKAEELKQAVVFYKPDLIIFNHNLSPSQERNLEKLLQCRIVDRTRLVLDIFAQRARSFEGRLQVELAQLTHQATRLVRGWTHLERQKGGIGLRGPGETQLEEDRRVIKTKITTLKQQLEKVREQRRQSRKARQRNEIPVVALVGYTNAGKSTLFNKITEARVYTADQLFATLDPTVRKIKLPVIGTIMLTDTVGFIHNLPPDLLHAFQATLEEVREADLLLHVVDISDPNWRSNISIVNNILREIGAEKVPQLVVYNKIDLTPHIKLKTVYHRPGIPSSIRISATKPLGLPALKQAIQKLLAQEYQSYDFVITPADAKLRAKLHELGAIVSEKIEENGNIHIVAKLHPQDFQRLS